MKTIRPGSTPEQPTPPWWVGKTVECPKCKGRFELEANDPVGVSAERHPGGKQWLEVRCPTTGCCTIIQSTRLDGGAPDFH